MFTLFRSRPSTPAHAGYSQSRHSSGGPHQRLFSVWERLENKQKNWPETDSRNKLEIRPCYKAGSRLNGVMNCSFSSTLDCHSSGGYKREIYSHMGRLEQFLQKYIFGLNAEPGKWMGKKKDWCKIIKRQLWSSHT